jgi:putative radical SAM enzyme (TIGR03279 family)
VSNISKARIIGVKEGSIAEEVELLPGDCLVSINGQEIKDILDYKFNEADSYIELEIEHSDGLREIYEIEKDESEELGIIFENELIDKAHNCHNKCIFCFMEQLPKNVRETLIFKDDDYRLSFFSGNYVTLTNMKKSDIDRIIKYRLSPINISVHATDEDVRCMMLNNRFAGKVLKYIDKLYEAHIDMNTQIVLCKDINDGEILKKTIKDLSKYAPILKSICIVPVGLSKNRDGLYPLKPLEKEDCIKTVNMINKFQDEFLKKFKTRLVYLADEIYLKAELAIPKYADYENFSQLENGVGMIAVFEQEFEKEIKKLKNKFQKDNNIFKGMNKKVTLVTGRIIEKYMNQKVAELKEIIHGLDLQVIAPINDFFGENITVTGLVVGRDIITKVNELKEKGIVLGDYLIIPKVMLKDDEDIFLDDTLLVDLQEKIDCKIIVSDGTANGFVKAILKNNVSKKISKMYKCDNVNCNSNYESSVAKNIN